MKEKLGQPLAALFPKHEKSMLSPKETSSSNGCGFSLAAFSCPASACLYDSATWGFFIA